VSRKATAATPLTIFGISFLLAALSPLPVRSDNGAPVVVVPPMTLGKSGVIYRNPTVAVAPDGAVTIAAESGPTNGSRLVVADLSAAGVGEAVTLDFAGPGDCSEPSLTYDSSGTLHLVWSERRAEAHVIRYVRRLPGKQWHDEGIISTTSALECEFPLVACDRSGRVWATWQAGYTTQYAVYLAWRDGVSSAVLDMTGARGDHHNLYPQLFPDSPYPVVWYEETGNSFRLRSAVPAPSRTTFEIVSPLDFDRLDVNQMPWLFQAPTGMLGGVWTDLVDNRVRVLMGFQSALSRGEGLVADSTLSGDAAQPFAVAVGEETVALAWTSRLPTGSAVFVGRVDGSSRVGPSLALPLPADDSFARPRLVAGGGRLVHCVWFSDASRGGRGSLYYAALRF